MSRSSPLMYAELLINIRQISVIAALETPCNASTIVRLSSKRDTLSLQHENGVAILTLPGQVAANTILQKPATGSTELSWRLPLAGEPTRLDPDANESPWPAQDLGKDTEMLCRECDAVIIGKGAISTWKDLPSENWAEMMDFWHCHKPSEHGHAGHSHGEDATENKGYSANAKLTAQLSVGFVDLTTFLLTAKDCPTVKLKTPTAIPSHHAPLLCNSCNIYIGHHDLPFSGYRLYKWRLKYSSPPPSSADYIPSTASILTTQLHAITLAQCTSKLLLLPLAPDPSTTPLHIWVLNPSLRYSTTATISPFTPKLAMKIFWKPVDADTASEMIAKESAEEVFLPSEAIAEVQQALEESAAFLPAQARQFQDWGVGLLERFEVNTGE